jgi:hypothetical protein
LLSLPAGTEMFHFPALPPAALCIQATATPHDGCRVSPFGNPRITARLPAPRGLSQAPTSFIGSWCQDIHRMLLETWLRKNRIIADQAPSHQGTRLVQDARAHCAVLKIRTEPGLPSPPSGRLFGLAARVGAPSAKRLLPQDPTACSPSRTPRPLVRQIPGECLLAALPRAELSE